MRPHYMPQSERDRRDRMTRGNAILLAVLVVVGWLAVVGAAQVLQLIARWVAL